MFGSLPLPLPLELVRYIYALRTLIGILLHSSTTHPNTVQSARQQSQNMSYVYSDVSLTSEARQY